MYLKTYKLQLLILILLFTTTHISANEPFMKGVGWDWASYDIQQMHELGVNSVRPDIMWHRVEPTILDSSLTIETVGEAQVSGYGVDWAYTDNLINTLADSGFTIIPRIGYGALDKLPKIDGELATPDRLGADQYIGCVYRHARAIVRRYRDKVHHWSIEGKLNEATLAVRFGWREGEAWGDPAFLTDLISALHNAVKIEDSSAKVAISFHTDIHEDIHNDFFLSSLAGPYHWTDWLENWQSYLDIIALDCYPNYYGADPIYGTDIGERLAMAKSIVPGKPVIILETGFPVPAPGVVLPDPVDFDEAKQAQYINDAINYAIDGGADGFFYFTIQSEGVQGGYTQQDLDALATIGPAFHDGNTEILIEFLSYENLPYITQQFPDVLQKVEDGWGIIRADGSKRPGYYILKEAYTNGINRAPAASNLSISPPTPTSQDNLTANYDYTDPDGDIEVNSKITWYKDGIKYGQTTTVPSSATTKGEQWYFTVKPYDGKQYGELQTSEVAVVGNTPPTASNSDISPDQPDTGDDLTISYSYSDIDGDAESNSELIWYMNGAEQPAHMGKLTLPSTATSKGQQWYFTVRPSDGTSLGELVTSDSVTIVNTPPSIESASISSDTETAIETSALSAFADGWNDADSDSESYKYQWYNQNGAISGSGLDNGVQGSTIASAAGSVIDGSLFDKGDEVYCAITPTDGTDDGVSKESNHLVIANSAPTAPTVEITPENPSTSDNITCLISEASDDVDGDTITYSYNWYQNDVLQPELTTNTVSSSETETHDIWKCVVTPDDGTVDGLSGQDSVAIGNMPPTASNLDISPDQPDTKNDLTASYDYNDVDGDTESNSEIKWYINGEEQPAYSGELTVPLNATAKGQQWHFTVKPNDGSGFGELVTSDSVTVVNTPPSIESASISSDTETAAEASILSASADGWNDADNDAEGYKYQWYNQNGAISGSGLDSGINGSTDSTIDGSLFDKGDEIYCILLPTDGTDDGAAKESNHIIIANSAPAAPTVNITPESPGTNDNIACAIVEASTDMDNDPITYRYNWYQNDALQPELTTNIVSSSETEANNIWKCVVTPNDGTVDGLSGQDSVIIGNTPPVADAGGIYQGEPGEIVEFDGSNSFDGDGDPLTYLWTFGDGETGSGVRPTHVYAVNGTYSVSLIVNDGVSDSTSANAKAYIYDPNQVQQIRIGLAAGWNLISIRVQPTNTGLEVVFADIIEYLDAIWAYDSSTQEWLKYVPDGPDFLNDLANVGPGWGYWIKMNQTATLIVTGLAVSTPVELRTGWNLVGYNNHVPKDIVECISSIRCVSVWTYLPDEAIWIKYAPDAPEFLNTLKMLEPEYGYWIEVEEDCIWSP